MLKISWTFFILAAIIGVILETGAEMTREFHERYYKNFEELECRGFFKENEYLRLELACSECGIWKRHYKYTDECRRSCYTTSHFKDCLDTFETPESSLPSYRRLIESLAGRQPDF